MLCGIIKLQKAELRIFNILSQLCGGCDSNGLTDLLQKQNSAKESEGFNVQSFNYGESDTVAHVIAHRNITAELSVSDISLNNNSYSGGNSNESFKTGFLVNRFFGYMGTSVLRADSYWGSGQNNRVVCLKDLINSQNNKSRTPAVVDVRGSETLQDWICNAERIHPDRVLMCFCFVMKYK